MTSGLYPCAHADDWMALDRRGALSTPDREALALHLKACADCRINGQLMADFAHSGAPAPGDELVFGRATKAVLARRPERRTRALRLAPAAALVLLVAGAASGAVLIRGRLLAPSDERDDLRRRAGSGPVRAAPSISSNPSGAAERPPAPLPPDAELPRQAPDTAAPVPASTRSSDPAEPASGQNAPSRPGAVHRARSVTSHVVASLPSEDAAAVFVRAVKEREQGRTLDAIATFRALQRQFPRSPQAMVSRVSLGDLLLDGGDAAAALVAFDAYLVAQPSGPLATEAVLGKARALSALGQGTHPPGGTP